MKIQSDRAFTMTDNLELFQFQVEDGSIILEFEIPPLLRGKRFSVSTDVVHDFDKDSVIIRFTPVKNMGKKGDDDGTASE